MVECHGSGHSTVLPSRDGNGAVAPIFVHGPGRRPSQIKCRTFPLPVELRAQLPDARSSRATHQAEAAAADVAVRIVELRVVENVEELAAEFKSQRFRNANSLPHTEVRIDDAGAMEETPAGVAKCPKHGVLLECICQEIPV